MPVLRVRFVNSDERTRGDCAMMSGAHVVVETSGKGAHSMRNVLKILKRDVLRLVHTPAALVVVVALLLLPSVYTWYNVIGFWRQDR